MNKVLFCGAILYILFDVLNGFVPTTQYCSLGTNHIACGHSGQLKYSCDIRYGGGIVRLNQDDRKLLLEMHNNRRSKVARGQIMNFPKALHMPQYHWNDELAYLAELNVDRCYYDHDQNHSTKKYRNAAQNIAMTGDMFAYPDKKTNIRKLVNMWFDEYRDTKMTGRKTCFIKTNSNAKIGHFTAMVDDKADQMGCAALNFIGLNAQDGRWYYWFYIVCNYSYGNMYRQQAYVPVGNGQSAAQGCKRPKSKKYPGLCGSTEPVEGVPNMEKKTEYINSRKQSYKSMKAARASKYLPIRTRTTSSPVNECR